MFDLSLIFNKKRRLKNVLILAVAVGILFTTYQIIIVKMIDTNETNMFDNMKIRNRQMANLLLNDRNRTFLCDDGIEIKLEKLNDDYCDCKDGKDEFLTNACNNGHFTCQHGFKLVKIPSSRVNDGICDCCDGSDENSTDKPIINLDRNVQKKIGLYVKPCPNTCPK